MTESTVYGGLEVEDDDDQEWKQSQREFEAQEMRVMNAPHVPDWIAELVRAGADKDKLLFWLVASKPTSKSLRRPVHERAKRLRKQAKALESMADDLDSTFNADTAFSEFWKILLFPAMFPDLKALPDFTRPREALKAQGQQMRRLAKMLRGEAASFMKLAKHHPRWNNKFYLQSLLGYVKRSTGEYHARLLVNLLDAAHSHLGHIGGYTEAQLLKSVQTRNRKMRSVESYGALPDD